MQFRKAALVPIVALSVAVTFAMLTKGHEWNDDFAGYVGQAVSILHGTERQTVQHASFTMRQSSVPRVPAAYPWGFPAVLAPLFAECGGPKMMCLKLVNLPFFALFLVVCSSFLRARLGPLDASLVVSIVAFCPVLLSFQNDVASDYVFLFLATLCVLLIDRIIAVPGRFEGSGRGNVWLGASLFAASFVRTSGLVLLPTLLMTQAFLYVRERRSGDWRRLLPVALVPYLTFVLLSALSRVLLPSGEGSYLILLREASLRQMADNVVFYFAVLPDFFRGLPHGLPLVLYGLLVPFVIAGAVVRCKDDSCILIYVCLTLLLCVVWPGQQGLRYAFPLAPFLVYLCYQGMLASAFALTDRHRREGELMTRAFWLAVAASFLAVSTSRAEANLARQRAPEAGPFDSSSAELFDFIRSRTAASDVVAFFQPRTLRLMTDRDALMINRCDQVDRVDVVAILKPNAADEPAWARDIQLSPAALSSCSPLMTGSPAFENSKFVAYRVPRPSGSP